MPLDPLDGEENKARDARADVVCMLIRGGGGGLARYYSKSARGASTLPDLVESTIRISDVDYPTHPNVISSSAVESINTASASSN